MIEWIMFFVSGFLAASLLAIMLIAVIHRRAVRLTRRRLQDEIPVSLVEMQADRDSLRAHFAISTRRLEMRVEQLTVKATTHLSEIGRNAGIINRLKSELARKATATDELAAKVQGLTGKLEEAESAKELDLVHPATEKSLEIDAQRVETAVLKTKIELYELQVGELQREIASKTHDLENWRVADLADSLRRRASAKQRANRKVRIEGGRDLGAISSTDRRQDHRGNQDPEQRPDPALQEMSLNGAAQQHPVPHPKRRRRQPRQPNPRLQ